MGLKFFKSNINFTLSRTRSGANADQREEKAAGRSPAVSVDAVEGADRKSATVTASPTSAIKRSFILKMELFLF